MGFTEELSDLRASNTNAVTDRDYWACVQACYDAGKGQLCADQCLKGATAEIHDSVLALFARYHG